MIETGDKVSLHFALKLDDGSLIDGNFGQPPATLVIGDGTLFNGFEARLLGLGIGDTGSFEIPPAKGFGPHNQANIRRFKRGQFSGMALEAGAVIAFADVSEAELPGVVVDINNNTVTVDFNHPLAGKTLTFDVKIVKVEKR